MKPLVGIDLDGVLADFSNGFFKLSRKYLNKPKKGFIQTTWNPEGFSQKDIDYIFAKIQHTRNFWMTLDKLPKTSELMKRASQMNLIFITSRVPTDGLSIVEQSQEWLYNQFALRDPLVIVAHKKGPVAKELGLEWFLDDRKENCVEVRDECEGCRVSILDTSYNQEFVDVGRGKGRIERVASVNEWLRGIGDTGRTTRTHGAIPVSKGAKK